MVAPIRINGFGACQESKMDIAVNPFIGAHFVPTYRFTDLVLGKIRGSITILVAVLHCNALRDSKNDRSSRANR